MENNDDDSNSQVRAMSVAEDGLDEAKADLNKLKLAASRPQKRVSSAIDKTSVDYDNYLNDRPFYDIMDILTCNFGTPQENIGLWIKAMEKGALASLPWYEEEEANDNSNNVNNNNNNNTWHPNVRDEETFIVEDPFIEVTQDQIDRYERDDGQDIEVGLRGYCTAFTKDGYELSGHWKKGKRLHRGLIAGPALEAQGIKAIWGNYKNGVLSGLGKADLLDQNCVLEGHFVKGRLHGPVRGLTNKGKNVGLCQGIISIGSFIMDTTGRLAWAGLFKHGRPYGSNWRGLEGGGFMYGRVGKKGLFEGPKNAFIYPDLETCLRGTFVGGKMANTQPVKIEEAYMEKSGAVMRLR